jgi:beta-glucanase (GH16 family)
MTCTQSGSTIYSGRFTSRQKFAMKYGWCASSIKMPLSKNGVGGAWFPAFWMLLVGYNTSPNYAEFDIIEQFGDSTTYSTHLYCNDNNANDNKESYKPVPVSQGSDASQAYHTYWMLWEADRIRVGVDSLIMGDWKSSDFSAGAWVAHFQQPMYYIFNFAAAPSWLPAPRSTDFPAQMLVDWAWYKPLSAL